MNAGKPKHKQALDRIIWVFGGDKADSRPSMWEGVISDMKKVLKQRPVKHRLERGVDRLRFWI